MPVSKKRGGAKAHANKVKQRNQNIKAQSNAFQKVMNQQMEELKKKYEEEQAQSGNTKNVEVVSQ
jgi:hypothetical protein